MQTIESESEYALFISDAEGNEGFFTGHLFLDGTILVPQLRVIGQKDAYALDEIWRLPDVNAVSRVEKLLSGNGAPGLHIRLVEIVRAQA